MIELAQAKYDHILVVTVGPLQTVCAVKDGRTRAEAHADYLGRAVSERFISVEDAEHGTLIAILFPPDAAASIQVWDVTEFEKMKRDQRYAQMAAQGRIQQ